MLFNTKKIIGVPVFTRGGDHLGKVLSFDVDVEKGQISTLHVRPSGLVKGLVSDDLIIGWDAIVEITDTRVIVVDSLARDRASRFSDVGSTRKPAASTVTGAACMKKNI